MPASAPLALLIRDGSHAGATTRLALKVEQLSISLTKTPIQIPIARSTPAILDLGITRPAITVSGLVELELRIKITMFHIKIFLNINLLRGFLLNQQNFK